jgi:hypothetical protein
MYSRDNGVQGSGVESILLPIIFLSPACAAVSAVAALGCVVVGADDAGTARTCGAVNAGLFVLVAVYCSVKSLK